MVGIPEYEFQKGVQAFEPGVKTDVTKCFDFKSFYKRKKNPASIRS